MAPRSFTQLVCQCRKAQGFKTQAQVASELGVSQTFLCGIEKGRRTPSLEKAVQLAYILDGDEAAFIQALLQDRVDEAGLDFRVEVHHPQSEKRRPR